MYKSLDTRVIFGSSRIVSQPKCPLVLSSYTSVELFIFGFEASFFKGFIVEINIKVQSFIPSSSRPEFDHLFISTA